MAAAAQQLRLVRAAALPKIKGGLRVLYRTLELPGANPLKDAHAALDAAVLAAYGFSAKKDLLAQLLALNLEVAAEIEKGEPVTAPGVPPNYPAAKKLVTKLHPTAFHNLSALRAAEPDAVAETNSRTSRGGCGALLFREGRRPALSHQQMRIIRT